MSLTDARRQPLPQALDSTEPQASVATTEPRFALAIRNSVAETDVRLRGEAHAGVVSRTTRANRIDRAAGDLTPGGQNHALEAECRADARRQPLPRAAGRSRATPACSGGVRRRSHVAPNDFVGMSPAGSDDRPRPSTTGAHQANDSGTDPRCISTVMATLPIAPSSSAERST